jgi:hypothetical protein
MSLSSVVAIFMRNAYLEQLLKACISCVNTVITWLDCESVEPLINCEDSCHGLLGYDTEWSGRWQECFGGTYCFHNVGRPSHLPDYTRS